MTCDTSEKYHMDCPICHQPPPVHKMDCQNAVYTRYLAASSREERNELLERLGPVIKKLRGVEAQRDSLLANELLLVKQLQRQVEQIVSLHEVAAEYAVHIGHGYYCKVRPCTCGHDNLKAALEDKP
jgi:hypothetical protein